MLNDITSHPLRVSLRRGDTTDPFIDINQQLKIVNNMAVLRELPDEFTRVLIEGMFEVRKPNLVAPDKFYVEYGSGVVTFDPANNGQTVNVSYKGRGVVLYPADRVYYLDGENTDVVTTLKELIATGGGNIGHNHDDRYAVIDHNHDSKYTLKSTKPYINVKDFGAIGDGVADDTIAINNALAQLVRGGSLIIGEGKYRITSPIVINKAYWSTVDIHGHIIADGCDGIHILGGGEGGFEFALRVNTVTSTNRTNAWNNQYVGILFQDINSARIAVDTVRDFHVGLDFAATSEGVAYLNTQLGAVVNCYTGIRCRVLNVDGWINECVWNGGRIYLESTVDALPEANGSWAWRFEPGNTNHQYNNHRFIGVCMEGNKNGMYIPGSGYFTLISPRFEGVEGMYLEGDDRTSDITIMSGYPLITLSKCKNLGARFNLIGRSDSEGAIAVEAWRGLGFTEENSDGVPQDLGQIRYHSGNRYFQFFDELGGMSAIGNGRLLNSSGNGWNGSSFMVNNGKNTKQWRDSTPSSGTYTAGDIIYNTSPTQYTDYILWGWICVESGSPGVWSELRSPLTFFTPEPAPDTMSVDAWDGITWADTDNPTQSGLVRYHTGNKYFEIHDQTGGVSAIGNGYMLTSDGNGWKFGTFVANDGQNRFEWRSSLPSSGTYAKGDIIWNTNPQPGGYSGWICTTAGIANVTMWLAESYYDVGTYKSPVISNGHAYVVIQAGITGLSEPSWPTASGATVNDETVVWQEAGLIVGEFRGFGVIE